MQKHKHSQLLFDMKTHTKIKQLNELMFASQVDTKCM